MIFNIIALIIAILSLVLIILLVLKKIQVLSMIDTKKIPEEKEAQVKKEILEGRLKRKIVNMAFIFKQKTYPYYDEVKNKIKKWYYQLLELEKNIGKRKNKTKDY